MSSNLVPSNDSELQLFRLLQRANLLSYYEQFIQNGGDDVQQLYDAYRQQPTQSPQSNGEEKMNEFIEIMKMVGMLKPLHVRRLQKALREWGANPAEFQVPIEAVGVIHPGQQMINRPMPILAYNNSNSQSLLHNMVPQTASISSASLSSPSLSHAQLATMNSINSPINNHSINHTINPSMISTTINSSINQSLNSTLPSSLCSTLSTSLVPTTMNSKISQTINSLMPSINSTTNSTLNTSVLNKSPCTVSTINNLCKSPSTIKNESYNIQTNLIQPRSVQDVLPVSNMNLINSSTKSTINNSTQNSVNNSINHSMTHSINNLMGNTFAPICCPTTNYQKTNETMFQENLNSNSPICMTNVLNDTEIQKLSKVARIVASIKKIKDKIAKECDLNPKDPKDTKDSKDPKNSTKPKNLKVVEHVLNMSEDDPRRIDEIRKYGSIYGRFDCKRRPEKPLSMHEIYVNEAAIQLCKINPILLINRKLLFELAREVVKQAGYQFTKGHSRSQYTLKLDLNNENDSLLENSDSIDIETLQQEDEEREYSSHDTSSDTSNGRSESNRSSDQKQSFSVLKDQNSKFTSQMINNSNCSIRNNQQTKEEINNSATTSNRSSTLLNHCLEERKNKLDQLEQISKQIEFNNGQIEQLRVQDLNENEIMSKLLKLENDQKLLIEEKNDLVKQIQKLNSFTTTSSKGNQNNFSSDSEDDTNSQLSIYSHSSSKDRTELMKLNSSPIHSDINNSQNSTDFNRSTLKRKLLDSSLDGVSPQKNKMFKQHLLKENKSDEESKSDQDENGIDLRISHNSTNKFKKDKLKK